MEKRAYLGEFIRYSSLNILGMIGLAGYILADTFFVAKGLGANGLAALNIALPIYSFIKGSGLMFGMGGATKYMIEKSRGKAEKGNQAFTLVMFITLCISVVFFLMGIFLSDQITWLLGANNVVFSMCKTYLQVTLLFAPVYMLNNVLMCFIRNDGFPQLSMYAMLGGSLANIVLDYVFIFPLKMGIFGAAFATGLAPVISILILLPFFLKKQNKFHLMKCKISGKLYKRVISSGLPSLITEVSSGIVIIVFNIIILKLQGNMGVAAYGVIANLSFVVISIYTGIAQGSQPLMSKNHGKGNREGVQTILFYAVVTVTILSAVLYGWLFFGAEGIVRVFNSENNPALQAIAVQGLRIYFVASIFAGFNIVVSVYFTSTEYSRPAHIISILRGFLLIIPMAFILSSIWGMTGVWCVFPVTEFLVALIGVGLYLNGVKKNAVYKV